MIELYINFLNWDYELRYKLAPFILVFTILFITFETYKYVKTKYKVIKWEKDLETRKNILKKAKEERTGRFSENENNNDMEGN